MNKKGISPVIAVALLVIVSVIAVVGFQTWFTTYSSQTQSTIEQTEKDTFNSNINSLVGTNLYVSHSGSNKTVLGIKINGVDCNVTDNLSLGLNEYDISTCLSQLSTGTYDVSIYTDDIILSEKIYYKADSVICLSGTHLESGSCTSNTRVCSITDGSGEQIWTDSWGTCYVTSCDGGFHSGTNESRIYNLTFTDSSDFTIENTTVLEFSSNVVQINSSELPTSKTYTLVTTDNSQFNTTLWQKIYNANITDYGGQTNTTIWTEGMVIELNSIATAGDIDIDSNGDILTLNFYTNSTTNLPESTLRKYSLNGTLLWKERINKTSRQYGCYGMTIDSEDNILIGCFDSAITGNTNYKMYVNKFNSSGSQLWAKYLGEHQYGAWVGDMITDSQNYIYYHWFMHNGVAYQYYWSKLAPSDGTVQWTQTYYPGYAQGKDIDIDSNGNLISAGWDTANTWMVRKLYNSTGAQIWQKNRDGRAYGIAIDSNDNAYVVGQYQYGSSAKLDTVKYDSAGNTDWTQTFEQDYNYGGADVAITSDNKIIVVSSVNRSGADTDMLTLWYNSSGSLLRNETFSYAADRNDEVSKVTVDSNDNIFIIGRTSNLSYGDNKGLIVAYMDDEYIESNTYTSYYALAFNDRDIWQIYDTSASNWRNISRNNSNTWQYNSAASGSESWSNCATNEITACISEAVDYSSTNQMTSTIFNSISASQWNVSNAFSNITTNSIDIAVGLKSGSASITPNVTKVTFNVSYDDFNVCVAD